MSLKTLIASIVQAETQEKSPIRRVQPLYAKFRPRSSKGVPSSLDCEASTHMPKIQRLPTSQKRVRYMEGKDLSSMPPTVAWMKARAQQTRDRLLREYSDDEKPHQSFEPAQTFNEVTPTKMGPKRQRSTFVKDEELKCMLEDRVGTPHISELQHDENITVHLDIEELGLAGEADLLITDEEHLEEAEPSD
jgi:hypothetical protein